MRGRRKAPAGRSFYCFGFLPMKIGWRQPKGRPAIVLVAWAYWFPFLAPRLLGLFKTWASGRLMLARQTRFAVRAGIPPRQEAGRAGRKFVGRFVAGPIPGKDTPGNANLLRPSGRSAFLPRKAPAGLVLFSNPGWHRAHFAGPNFGGPSSPPG